MERLKHLWTTIPGAIIIVATIAALSFLLYTDTLTTTEIIAALSALGIGGGMVAYKRSNSKQDK